MTRDLQGPLTGGRRRRGRRGARRQASHAAKAPRTQTTCRQNTPSAASTLGAGKTWALHAQGRP